MLGRQNPEQRTYIPILGERISITEGNIGTWAPSYGWNDGTVLTLDSSLWEGVGMQRKLVIVSSPK
jgi:hypothetical protein